MEELSLHSLSVAVPAASVGTGLNGKFVKGLDK